MKNLAKCLWQNPYPDHAKAAVAEMSSTPKTKNKKTIDLKSADELQPVAIMRILLIGEVTSGETLPPQTRVMIASGQKRMVQVWDRSSFDYSPVRFLYAFIQFFHVLNSISYPFNSA